MGRIKESSESGSEQLQNPKNPHRKTLPGPGVGMPGMQGLNEKAPFLPMGGGPGPRGTLEKTKKPTKPIPTRMGTKNHLSFEFQEEPSHKKEGKKAPMGTKGHLLCKFQGEPSLSKLVRAPLGNWEATPSEFEPTHPPTPSCEVTEGRAAGDRSCRTGRGRV